MSEPGKTRARLTPRHRNDGVLAAQWRVLSPGGEKTLNVGGSRHVRQGPLPDASASGAVATLSGLVADFSRQLAQALQEATPTLASPR